MIRGTLPGQAGIMQSKVSVFLAMLRPLGDVDHVSYVITSRIFNLGYSLSCIFQMFVCTSLLLMRNPTLFYHLDFLSYYPLILQFYVHRFPNPPPRVHPHRFQ